MIAGLLTALFVLLVPIAAGAEVPVTDCDRLAAHGFDDARVVAEGVAQADIDLPAAIAACATALSDHPGTARLSYQLGRVLFYDGQVEASLPYLHHAADLGHLQSMFVLGWIYRLGADVPAAPCRAAGLWRDAAIRGQFWSRFYLALDSLEGRFDGCWVTITASERMALLEAARRQAEADPTYASGLDEVIGLIARVEALMGTPDTYVAP